MMTVDPPSVVVRDAIAADIATVAEMGERFHAEAGWGDVIPYCRADCAETLGRLIESPDGILLVAERDGQLIGMAGGLAHPSYFNFSHRTGQELFWWVAPGLRDGTGAALFDQLEDRARELGCVSWGMIAVDKLSPVVGRLYRRRGYRPSEHSFIKRL